MAALKIIPCLLMLCLLAGLRSADAQVRLDTSDIQLRYPDISPELKTQIVFLTDSAFQLYYNRASLIDDSEGKVTETSIREFRSLFSNNAQVYNLLLKEPQRTGMNISDYISLVYTRLEKQGVIFTVSKPRLATIDFDAGGYYQATVTLEMTLYNGLDSKGRPKEYQDGHRFNVRIEYDIDMDRLEQASILNLVATPLVSGAIDRFELAIQGGAAVYQGDLTPPGGGLSSLGWVQHTYGISLSYRFDSRFRTRLGFQYAYLTGSDLESENPDRRIRNLSFFTDLYEFSAVQEVHILELLKLRSNFPIKPYVFGGLAVFRFNPKTVYQGEIHELQPLGTEGQGIESYPEPYALTQIAIPLGAGFRYNLNETLAFQAEFSIRKLFTDYLDDVSGNYVDYAVLSESNGALAAALNDRSHQVLGRIPGGSSTRTAPRGNPDNNDSYMFATLGVTIQLSELLKRMQLIK
jgi:hypothetical protein